MRIHDDKSMLYFRSSPIFNGRKMCDQGTSSNNLTSIMRSVITSDDAIFVVEYSLTLGTQLLCGAQPCSSRQQCQPVAFCKAPSERLPH